jgi:hypothetical protein
MRAFIYNNRKFIGPGLFISAATIMVILFNYVLQEILVSIGILNEDITLALLVLFIAFLGFGILNRGTFDLFDDPKYLNLLLMNQSIDIDLLKINAKVIGVENYYVQNKDEMKEIIGMFNLSKKDAKEYKENRFSAYYVRVQFKDKEFYVPSRLLSDKL